LYLKDLPIANSIEVKNRLTKTKLRGEFSQLLILLEEPLGNNSKVFKKLFEDKIYLINKINSKLEANNWYTYKIYNDLADFKKLLFLIVLLKQVL
jgi:tRNA-binding EMAP/Myf-like protein